jgi:hypothetical protein
MTMNDVCTQYERLCAELDVTPSEQVKKALRDPRAAEEFRRLMDAHTEELGVDSGLSAWHKASA